MRDMALKMMFETFKVLILQQNQVVRVHHLVLIIRL